MLLLQTGIQYDISDENLRKLLFRKANRVTELKKAYNGKKCYLKFGYFRFRIRFRIRNLK